MPAYLNQIDPVSLVARIAALAVLSSAVMGTVLDTAAYGWVQTVLMTAAVTLALTVLILPALITKPQRTSHGQLPVTPLEPAITERPQDDLQAVQLAANQEKAVQVADELEGYRFFTRLLRKQIEVVVGITESASTTIITCLRDVDKVTESLLAFIEQSGSNAHDSPHFFLDPG